MGKKQRRHYEHVPKPGPGAHVVLYLRYSHIKQGGNTIEKQRRLCHEFAAKQGWIIVAEYVEPATTAKDDEIDTRPQFRQLLADAQAGQFAAVIVESIDRWGRSETAFYLSLAILDKANVYWTTAVEPIYDSAAKKGEGTSLTFGLTVGLASAYSMQLSRKVTAGMRTQALQGYHHSSLPYGYMRSEAVLDTASGKIQRRTMIPDPETFPNLGRIAELCLLGWGAIRIGEAVGLPPSRVVGIMANKTYVEFRPGCGHGTIITREGEEVEGLHEPAWTQETWTRMRQMVAERHGRPRATANWRRAYPLGGLLRCVDCGLQMIARTKHHLTRQGERTTYRYYECYDHDRPKCPSGVAGVNCATAENVFGALLRPLAALEDWQEALETYLAETVAEVPDLTRQIQDIQERMERLDAKLDMKRISIVAYRQQMAQWQIDLRALQAQESHEERDAARSGTQRLIDIGSAWEDATAEQRQQMATLLIQPRGLIWQHRGRQIIGIKPFEEFVAGFTLALGWRRHGLWLWRDDSQMPDWIEE
jgi:site-specific DNA recombinase